MSSSLATLPEQSLIALLIDCSAAAVIVSVRTPAQFPTFPPTLPLLFSLPNILPHLLSFIFVRSPQIGSFTVLTGFTNSSTAFFMEVIFIQVSMGPQLSVSLQYLCYKYCLKITCWIYTFQVFCYWGIRMVADCQILMLPSITKAGGTNARGICFSTHEKPFTDRL